MREARKTAQAFLQNIFCHAERQCAGRRAAGVLRIVQPAQRADAADAAISLRAPPDARTIASRSTVTPSASGRFTETRTTRLPACSM